MGRDRFWRAQGAPRVLKSQARERPFGPHRSTLGSHGHLVGCSVEAAVGAFGSILGGHGRRAWSSFNQSPRACVRCIDDDDDDRFRESGLLVCVVACDIFSPLGCLLLTHHLTKPEVDRSNRSPIRSTHAPVVEWLVCGKLSIAGSGSRRGPAHCCPSSSRRDDDDDVLVRYGFGHPKPKQCKQGKACGPLALLRPPHAARQP